MARFRLSLEYVGTRYRGWQVQKNARTVQGELNGAVREVSGRADFETYGSGRTDAGVHALDQVAHLDLETRLAPETLRRALNEALPADINVLAVEKVTRQFHARHGALARSYLYQISRRRTAFAKPFVWWLKDPLDAARMREAGALFEGMHDFRSFAEDDPRKASTRVPPACSSNACSTRATARTGRCAPRSGSSLSWGVLRRTPQTPRSLRRSEFGFAHRPLL